MQSERTATANTLSRANHNIAAADGDVESWRQRHSPVTMLGAAGAVVVAVSVAIASLLLLLYDVSNRKCDLIQLQ